MLRNVGADRARADRLKFRKGTRSPENLDRGDTFERGARWPGQTDLHHTYHFPLSIFPNVRSPPQSVPIQHNPRFPHFYLANPSQSIMTAFMFLGIVTVRRGEGQRRTTTTLNVTGCRTPEATSACFSLNPLLQSTGGLIHSSEKHHGFWSSRPTA